MLAVNEIGQIAEAKFQFAKSFLGGGEIDQLGFFDQRADPIDAAAFAERARHRLDDLVEAFERDGAGIDLLPARRFLAQCRDVHVAEIGQHQRARDRRRGQHQEIDRVRPCGSSARR